MISRWKCQKKTCPMSTNGRWPLFDSVHCQTVSTSLNRQNGRKERVLSKFHFCQIFSPKGKVPTLERAFKHRKNCDSCPTKVTWKVKLECQFCLSCLSPPIGQDDIRPSYYSKWKLLMTVFVWKLKVVWSHITSILCEGVGGYLTMCAHCRVDVSQWQNNESLN